MISELRDTSYELRGSCRRARSAQTLTPRASKLTTRLGVTLIELLITISIVATLGAFFLGVSTAAMESSRASRTRALIGKIHDLLMEHMETYATRRVDIPLDIYTHVNAAGFNSKIKGQILADARLLAIRELMKLEMPDRWSDVLNQPIPNGTVSTMTRINPFMLETFPALSNAYLRRFYTAANKVDDGETLRRNQGAECLYMIIMFATGEGEARTLFSEQDIGDTDNDGAPEFLDGWGRPIRFVRWPAGFTPQSELMSGNSDQEPDPFDPFLRDSQAAVLPTRIALGIYPSRMSNSLPYGPNIGLIEAIQDRNILDPPISAFRLVPLIYSNGPDGVADLTVDTGKATQLDPYAAIYDVPSISLSDLQLATVVDTNNDSVDNSLDNIHNHILD